MNTDKRTIKNDKEIQATLMNIKEPSYLLSVLSVSIGGNPLIIPQTPAYTNPIARWSWDRTLPLML
jgi:hypothetical protein